MTEGLENTDKQMQPFFVNHQIFRMTNRQVVSFRNNFHKNAVINKEWKTLFDKNIFLFYKGNKKQMF